MVNGQYIKISFGPDRFILLLWLSDSDFEQIAIYYKLILGQIQTKLAETGVRSSLLARKSGPQGEILAIKSSVT